MGRILIALAAASLVALGGYNFISFMTEIQRLGGDASSGYVQGGHYFVGSHGRYTEVTSGEWEENRLHLRSLLLTHPLALLGMGYLVLGVALPKMMGRPTAGAEARVQSVLSSGLLLASATCRARIGRVNVFVRVAVHAGGIVIKPMWSSERAVLAHEIVASRQKKGVLARGIEIEHAAVDIASPIALRVANDSSLADAIRKTRPWAG